MPDSNYRHIFLSDAPKTEKYRSRQSSRDSTKIPDRDRSRHGHRLREQLVRATSEAVQRKTRHSHFSVEGAATGTYYEFSSDPDFDLYLKSLENRSKGIELTAVCEQDGRYWATVFVPDGASGYFLQRIEQYLSAETPGGHPKNRRLVESIGEIRLATVWSLWTDLDELYPDNSEKIWWEVWLRRTDGDEIDRLRKLADNLKLRIRDEVVSFVDRKVILVWASPQQLAASLDVMGDLAELRLAKQATAGFMDMPASEQAEWVSELLDQLLLPTGEVPAVCILDTGINRVHPLLEGPLVEGDRHAYRISWGVNDHDGHGTEMAGIAMYGDLTGPLLSSGQISLEHCLESVKILPPEGKNEPRLYGAITADAASQVEITAPYRKRVFVLAVTVDGRDRGRPSSWSAEIDSLASGADDTHQDAHRLYVISAGNQETSGPDYFSRALTDSVQDPGQAWNAITVGAYTQKCRLEELASAGWAPISPSGDLSPESTSSRTWVSNWPVKPDLVFEGGNIAVSPDGVSTSRDSGLSLLTTNRVLPKSLFQTSTGTSPAAAGVARLAAILQAEYPDAWPETIRALLVHSSRWTDQMCSRFDLRKGGKTERESLLRVFGFGVPDLDRARHSARNHLTLISQAQIRPFDGKQLQDMHIYDVPWPKEVLRDMAGTDVTLRVTLSYFVEPNPASRGWTTRHRYSSHGLRFDVKTPEENITEFRIRLNKLAHEDGVAKTRSDAREWFLGPILRHKGSLHSDVWTGDAAYLADKGVIGIFPVTGWWKERHHLNRGRNGTRYSLVVSIETDRQDIDLYTPVAIKVGTPVTVNV